MQDMPVELRAVVLRLEKGALGLLEERERRRARPDREHHDVSGERLAGRQAHTVGRKPGDLGPVRRDRAVRHVPVVAGRGERGRRAQVRQERVLGQHGCEARRSPSAPCPRPSRRAMRATIACRPAQNPCTTASRRWRNRSAAVGCAQLVIITEANRLNRSRV